MTTARAHLLLHHARLWSDGRTLARDASLAVRDGHIAAIGSREELRPLEGSETEVIDARGASVTPGLTDAHLHLVAWAKSLEEIPLGALRSAADCAAVVARHARAEAGRGALIGRGWDANLWPDRPHRALLDQACPERPVLLHSKDYHALWVNGAALRAAGVTRDTPDPPGGRFERDASGEPDGIVREHAVRAFVPLAADDPAGTTAAIARAAGLLHREGVTAVHDFEGADAFRALRAMSAGPGPRVRVLMHVPHAGLDAALALGLESGVGDDAFRVGGIKLFADGTLGSRTAAMLEPYEGAAGRGMELMTPRELAETVRRALVAGLAVAIHAIGDRAVRNALDAFEAAGDALGRPRLPSRIEHLQLVDPEDAPRLARLGIAASMQPLHCTSDIDLADRAWGSRCAHAYPWRRMLASGAPLAFGSDAPVEPPAAAAGLFAATTRSRPDRTPAGGWHPAERLSLDEALSCYTSAPARLAGSWPRLGTLRPGARADVVVWSDDLHARDPLTLGEARPRCTIADGRIVFRDEESGASESHVSALPGARRETA
jgi:hypothetical protein